MEETIISLLQERLSEIEGNILSFEESLAVGLKITWEFNQGNIDTLEKRITDFKQQKAETVSCIKWLKSI